MTAVTPFLKPQPVAAPSLFAGTLAMGNNIGRDILSRATDFQKTEVAIYEYVANAYESYDVGQLPVVDVTVEGGKDGFVVVEDNGIGMDANDVTRFWSMHAQTLRRAKGLNRRGYHGTGKIAFVAIARQIRVETVKDGVLNITSLSKEAVTKAAETNGPVEIDVIAYNEPTDRPNGTKITISRLQRKITTDDIRLLREKIAMELTLFMKGGQVSVNGILVQPNTVSGEETRVVSDCGNFTASIVYNEIGHHEDLSFVFYACDGIFIAREQTGKEGHRFSHRVHVQIDTTPEWAEANFNHCREQFVSEARDLRLKVADPAPRALRDFAESCVRAFMKRLDEEDARRREEEKTEARKQVEKELSRVFSPFYTGGAGPRPHVIRKGDKVRTKVTVREQSGQNPQADRRDPRGNEGKLKFDFKDYKDSSDPYVIEEDNLTVLFNTASPFLKSLSQQEDHPARKQALYDLAASAVAYIEAKAVIERDYADKALEEPMLVAKATLGKHAEILARIKNELAANYAMFHIAAQAGEA